jgi:hypothetical protein
MSNVIYESTLGQTTADRGFGPPTAPYTAGGKAGAGRRAQRGRSPERSR